MQTYNLPEILRGDTFQSRDVLIKNQTTNTPVDLTGYAIKCEFRKEIKTGTLVKTLSLGSGLTLTDAVNGIFTIDDFVVEFEVGIYWYDFQMTSPSEIITTMFGGYMPVLQDVTQ